jgi:transcriptional regulator with XRE-family HTH domain
MIRTGRVGKQMSEGTRALWREMGARKWSQGDLGRELGTKSAVVNRWLHGDRKPDRTFALRIESLLGIDPALWDEPLGRASIPQLRNAS